MRGRERVLVAGLLTMTSAATGALVGFAAGVLWRLAGVLPSWWVAAVVVAVAVLLDLLGLAPLSVRRQVPQLWGRIFPAPTVAVLYGSRLGVGPLTILRTWLWWAALVVGAWAGPWGSAGVGALFGAARVVVMIGAGTRAGRRQTAERRVGWVLGAAALAAVGVGWSLGAEEPRERGGGAATAAPVAGDRTDRSSDVVADPPTTGADAADGAGTDPPVAPAEVVPDQGLADALPEEVLAGFVRVADDPRRRLGPLDLRAAAAIEGDEAAERALLETRRFLRGHARAWRGPSGSVAHASVYVFGSPADAEAYRVDGLTTIEARGARVYDVAPPAGGRGFSQAGQASAGAGSTVAHGVTFVRGDRFYLVFVTSPDSSLGPADAASAANAVASATGG